MRLSHYDRLYSLTKKGAIIASSGMILVSLFTSTTILPSTKSIPGTTALLNLSTSLGVTDKYQQLYWFQEFPIFGGVRLENSLL